MGYVSFGTKCKESEKQRKNTKQNSSLKHGLKVRDKMSNKSTKATGRGASNAKNNETRAKTRMKISAEKLITAAEKSNGIMSVCARLAGINRRTVEKYFELVPEAKNAFMEQREVIIDLAESKLLNMVNAGDKDAVFLQSARNAATANVRKPKYPAQCKQSLTALHSKSRTTNHIIQRLKNGAFCFFQGR